MSTLGRYLLLQATGCTLKALLCLWPLALIASLGGALERTNPLLSLRPWLALGLVTVLGSPFLFAVSAAAGMALLRVHLLEAGEALAAEVGRCSSWWALRWTLPPAAILSAASLFLFIEYHPSAASELRGTSWLEPELVPEMMGALGSNPMFDHIAYSGKPVAQGRVADFRLLIQNSGDSSVAMAAQNAAFELSSGRYLRIVAKRGTACFQLTGEQPVHFGEALVEMNIRSLIRRGQRSWAQPQSRPFSQLGRDSDYASQVAGEEARRAKNKYFFERFYRAVLGLLPLFAAAQVALALSDLLTFKWPAAIGYSTFLAVSLLSNWFIVGARSLAAGFPIQAIAVLACSTFLPGTFIWGGLRLLRNRL
ncbi:MAG: hypothetical protein CMK00_04025 [Planctomycetes bacterium]|nr:hypothetical protein [Planctomycetota bacterium]